MRICKILLSALLLGLLAQPGPAAVSWTNRGFETGNISGWTTNAVSYEDTVQYGRWQVLGTFDPKAWVATYPVDPSFPSGPKSDPANWPGLNAPMGGYTYSPKEGSYFLKLSTGASGPDEWVNTSQTVTVAANDSLSGYAAFVTMENPPQDPELWQDDEAQVVVLDSGNNVVATPWQAAVSDSWDPSHPETFAGQTPWTPWSWQAATAGTYTIQYRVKNTGDNYVVSAALFDTPETVAPPQPDLLVKQTAELDTAYGLNDVYQGATPSGEQIETLVVRPGATASYAVKVQNDSSTPVPLLLKAVESAETGWGIVYRNGAGTDISAGLRGTGYWTGSLATGTDEVITVEVTPGAGAAGATSKSITLRAFADGAASDPADTVQLTTWVYGTQQADLLLKLSTEADTAYALNDVYQGVPSGGQARGIAVKPKAVASYDVKVQNDGNLASAYLLKASESAETGWVVSYSKGGTDISAQMRSAEGYTTGTLSAGGGAEVITVAVSPTAASSPGTGKTVQVKAYRTALAANPDDVVKTTTWAYGVEQADLLLKLGTEADAAYATDDAYQWVPSGAQVRGGAVKPNTPATYQVKVENDGNVARTFVVKAEETAETGWVLAYKKQDGTSITTDILSAAGYTTGTLAGGASEVITVEVTPLPQVAPGTGKSVLLKLFRDGAATGWYDAVKAITWAFSAEQADLLIKLGGEADTAYALNNTYQWVPGGSQVRGGAVKPNTAATYQVKVENDGNVARTFVVKAEETAETGWVLAYKKQDGTSITADILSPAGYTTGTLAGGASEVITVEMKPTLAVPPATGKSVLLKVFRDGTATGWYDAVKAMTWVLRLDRADLLIKKDADPDTAYAIDDEYQWVPSGAQVVGGAVSPNATATYQVKVQNDGNAARTFTVKASETAETGWSIVYRKEDGGEITGLVRDTGYVTGTLAPGAFEVLTVEMTPVAVPGGTGKTTQLRVYADGAAANSYDAVQAITWEFGP